MALSSRRKCTNAEEMESSTRLGKDQVLPTVNAPESNRSMSPPFILLLRLANAPRLPAPAPSGGLIADLF